MLMPGSRYACDCHIMSLSQCLLRKSHKGHPSQASVHSLQTGKLDDVRPDSGANKPCLCRDSLLLVGALLRLVREALLRRGGTLGDLEAVLVCPLLLPPADTVTRCVPASCGTSVPRRIRNATWASGEKDVQFADWGVDLMQALNCNDIQCAVT